MKLIKFAAIFVIVLFIYACATTAKKEVVTEPEKPLTVQAIEKSNEAIDFYGDKEYEEAILRFKDAISLLKQAAPEATEADSIPQLIYRFQMNIAKIYNDLAFYHFEQKKYEEALDNFENSLSKYKELTKIAIPEDSINVKIEKLYNNSAIAARKNGDFQKALDYYDQYLKMNPEDSDALLQKFIIYREDLKNEEQAFTILKAYAATNKDFTSAHLLGDFYKDKNDNKNAIEWYEKAREIRPDPNVLQKLSSVYRANRQYDKSNQILEQLVSSRPGQEDLKTAYKLIGDNYRNLKNKVKAAEYFEKYLELEKNEDIALYICSYYYDLKNNAKMVYYANIVLSLNPNNSYAYLLRGIARYNTKDMKGAKSDFERIKDDPKNGDAAKKYLSLIK